MTLTREGCRADVDATNPCPAERIILCIDTCEERPQHRFPNHDGRSVSCVSAAKKCAEAFLLNKSTMNSDHQFSLLVWRASNIVMSAFHNRAGDHVKALQGIAPNLPPAQPTPLSSIFQYIFDRVFKNVEEEHSAAPLRLVFFYGRPGGCTVDENVLSDLGNVTIDVLYIHKPISSVQEKNRIGENLTQLKSCLSEKSFCAVALADSLLTLKYTMKFLIHPNLRS